MNRIEDTTKQICENGDLTHDYAINLAKMVDARTEEIKRLAAKLEQAEKALELFADDDSWHLDDHNNLPICFDFNINTDPGEVAKDALRAIRL